MFNPFKKRINIVIPAGGIGKRFENTEFRELKPFIKINGKSMFEHLILNVLSKYIYIIIQEQFKQQYQKEIDYLESKYPVKFCYINKLSEGATCTALSLYDKLNNNNFTILMNCDQVVDIDINWYIKKHKQLKADGSLLCFDKENSKKWSFVQQENNIVKRVVAKDNISDIAVCGWYAWSRGRDFIKYGIQQIINQDKVNNEYYLCPIYNYAIKDGLKIVSIIIDKSRMHGLGTPEDLKEYLNNRKK